MSTTSATPPARGRGSDHPPGVIVRDRAEAEVREIRSGVRVGHEHDAVIEVVRVARGGHRAVLGHQPRDQQRVGARGLQDRLQPRVDEGAVAGLVDDRFGPRRGELGDDLHALGAGDERRAVVEITHPPGVTAVGRDDVADEDHLGAGPARGLQQQHEPIADLRRVGRVQGAIVVEVLALRIDHQQRRPGRFQLIDHVSLLLPPGWAPESIRHWAGGSPSPGHVSAARRAAARSVR